MFIHMEKYLSLIPLEFSQVFFFRDRVNKVIIVFNIYLAIECPCIRDCTNTFQCPCLEGKCCPALGEVVAHIYRGQGTIQSCMGCSWVLSYIPWLGPCCDDWQTWPGWGGAQDEAESADAVAGVQGLAPLEPRAARNWRERLVSKPLLELRELGHQHSVCPERAYPTGALPRGPPTPGVGTYPSGLCSSTETASQRSQHALKHVRDACRDCLPVVAGKTFPEFPAYAQPVILRIW